MAAITYTFAPLSDVVLFDVAIPRKYKPIHAYCMKRLQLKDWRLQPADIALHFDCSLSTARRALRCFRDLGYAIYDMVKGWRVFPSPQATVNEALEQVVGWSLLTPQEAIRGVIFAPLIEKEAFKEKEQQHEPIITPDQAAPAVVVFSSSGENLPGTDHDPMPIPEGDPLEPEPTPLHDPEPIQEPVKEPVVLEYPPQLTKDQLNSAKNSIKKCKDAALKPDVLFAFAYYLSRGGVKNPCAYLAGLVRDANNGVFTPIQAAGASNKGGKPRIPIHESQGQPKPGNPEKAKVGIQQAKLAARGAL